MGHVCRFKPLIWVLCVQNVPFGPKAYVSSIDHVKGIETHVYFSVPPNHAPIGTGISTHTSRIHSNHILQSFKVSFLTIDSQIVPLGSEVKVSSLVHFQGPTTNTQSLRPFKFHPYPYSKAKDPLKKSCLVVGGDYISINIESLKASFSA